MSANQLNSNNKTIQIIKSRLQNHSKRLQQVIQAPSAQQDCTQSYSNKNFEIQKQLIQKKQTVKKGNQIKLEYQIQNLLKQNKNNPLFVSSYFKEILQYQKSQEHLSVNKKGFIQNIKCTFTTQQFYDVRAKYIDCILSICWVMEYEKSMHSTIYVFNKMVENKAFQNKNFTKELLDQFFITSLFISLKLCEIYPPDLTDLLYNIGSNMNKNQILSCEVNFLLQVNFRLIYYPQLDFLDLYLILLKIETQKKYNYYYLVEIGYYNLDLCFEKPSLKAISIIYFINYFEEMKGDESYPEILKKTLKYNESQLKRVSKLYLNTLYYLKMNKITTIFQKYSEEKYMQATKKHLS